MSFDPSGLTVYVDGEYVNGAEASVSLWDHGLLYGDGIFEERDVWPMELYIADGLFATGSGAGIVPIAEVDGNLLATATDPIVAALSEGYRARTRDPRFLVPVTRAGQ